MLSTTSGLPSASPTEEVSPVKKHPRAEPCAGVSHWIDSCIHTVLGVLAPVAKRNFKVIRILHLIITV